jgi:hypothetical protein
MINLKEQKNYIFLKIVISATLSAGYEEAIEFAKKNNVKISMLRN